MNILDLQDKLKNLSQQQLVQEMQMPTGQMPQFLVLSELTRRKKMEDSFAIEQGRDQSTVAQDAVAAAGMPAEFAGQMAGAMAPQTDMVGNTGAMPRQSAMPPQRMAGGGIVALQEGGGPIRAPRLVVRNGRQFAEMDDGSLIPLSELGVDQTTSTDAASAPRGFEMDLGPTATQGDLDQRYLEETLGIDRMRASMPAPESISGMPSVPGGDSLVGRETPALQPALAQTEGDFPSLFMDPTTAQPDQPNAPRLGGRGRTIDPIIQNAPPGDRSRGGGDRGAETGFDVESFLFPLRGTPGSDQPEYPSDAFTLDPERRAPVVPGQTTGAPLEMPAGGAEELLPPTVDPAPPGPPRTPSGGGIAGIAAQGAGAPSDYEQELLNMLQSREKRATQDKWLALAQAGLSLMSSKNPTFGGALGEAGATGLGALREGQSTAEADRVALLGQIEQSRMGREKLGLERQALAARGAAAGRDKGIPATVITPLFNQLEQAQERLASLGSPPEPGFFFDSPDPNANERLRAAQDVQRAQNQINAAYAQYGLQPFGDGQGSTYDARD
jgi:hypothetical protein